MKSRWIIGIPILCLVITALTFHVYIDEESQPVIEAVYNLVSDGNESDMWTCTDTLTKLTDNNGRYENPVWSPDGTTVAFESDGWIYIADADHANARKLVEGFDPAFSPAGDKVMFVRPIELDSNLPTHRINGIEVLAVGSAGGDAEIIAKLENVTILYNGNSKSPDYLVWSPSNRYTVLRVYEKPISRPSVSYLAIWDIEGNTLKYIDTSMSDWPPSWSPDEQELVCSGISFEEFSEGKRSQSDLWLINVETCKLTQLTDTPDIDERNPLWSPNGSKIAFMSWDSGLNNKGFSNTLGHGSDIYTIDSNGANRNLIVNRIVPWLAQFKNEHVLTWGPNDSAVVYFSWGLIRGSHNAAELSQELWQVGEVKHESYNSMSIGILEPLVRAPLQNGFLGDISWSPKGDKLAFEWTTCDITVTDDVPFGCIVQVDNYDAPNQTIYVVDLPEDEKPV